MDRRTPRHLDLIPAPGGSAAQTFAGPAQAGRTGAGLETDMMNSEQSQGHLGVDAQGREYFERDGEVYRAALDMPVMTDGYRCGRWEGSRSWFDHYHQVEGDGIERKQG